MTARRPVPCGDRVNGNALGCSAAGSQNDFCSFIGSASTNPRLTLFVYTASMDELHAATLLSSSVAAVPEPASWALMIGGFGLTGAALRRRRTTVAFA